MPKGSFTLFLLLLSLVIASLASQAVPSQRLDVRYDPDTRTLRGVHDVSLSSATETVYFALLPNLNREPNPNLSARQIDAQYPFGFEPSALLIDAVVQSPSGTALPFRLLSLPRSTQTYGLEDTVLAVDLSDAGATPRFRIHFETLAPRVAAGDNGVTAGILTWRFGWYPLLLEEGASIVEDEGTVYSADGPGFPFVLPWTEMTATVRAPADLVFASGADHVTRSPAAQDGMAVHIAEFSGPTRSFGIALGADYSTYRLDGPTPIEVVFRPGHEETARLLATYAREMIESFSSTYGPYPRARLTVVESPNRTGTSFAADGVLWLSGLFFTHRDTLLPGILNRFMEFVLAHEIAHQWLGLGTGVDLDRDNWLSEGLAQYASITYFEERHGALGGNLFGSAGEGLLEDLVDRQFGFYNLREHQVEFPYLVTVWEGFDEALVKPAVDVEYAHATVSRLYYKGYLVARTIESAIGEEAFRDGLRAAFETYRADRLTPEALQEILEEISGHSLDVLFDAWVFGDVQADYSVRIVEREPADVGYRTTVEVTRAGGIPQPVEVEVTLTSDATTRQTWDGETEEATLVFHTPSPIQRATIDPEHRIPDTNRLNNNDPVRIVSAVNRAALPLDAYVLSPDAASGGFSFGWLDRFRVTVRESSASLMVNQGRSHSLAGIVDTAGGALSGQLTYTHTLYHQPPTGAPSVYWEPDVLLSLGLQRLAVGEDPFWTLRLAATNLPSIGSSSIQAVALEFAREGSLRASLTAFDEVRVVPQLYLEGVATLGVSSGPLPDALRFGFAEIHAFDRSPVRNKLTGRVALDLTTTAEPFNLLNMAMIDRNRTRLFLAGGMGWTSPEDCCTTTPDVEVGIEQVLELSTLGGLIPFRVRLGVATPITPGGTTVLYVGISL